MVQVVLSNCITLEGNLPLPAEEYLRKRLIFANPAFEEAEKHGRWTGNIPGQLSFITTAESGLVIPRGFLYELIKILQYNNVPYEISDQTRALKKVAFTFTGSLYPFQQRAVSAILAKPFGILNSPTGSGKTVIALFVIAQRKQPTLIVCHTKELLYQWRERAVEFLGLEPDEIGLIGDQKESVGQKLTIAIINSLYKCAAEVRDKIGFLVVDECHRIPARTFTEAVEQFDCRYMLGLSATAFRRDKLTKVIYFYLGDRVCDIEPQELQKINKIMVAKLVVRPTNFDSLVDPTAEYQALITELTEDEERNRLIVADVLEEAKKVAGICLVLSDRKTHCEKLLESLAKEGVCVKLLTGTTPKKEREAIVGALAHGTVQILVATGSLLGEGFDCKQLSSLFITTPVRFTGRVIQYLGRILRTAEGKAQPKVFDYVDKPGVLRNSFRSRCNAYEKMGVVLATSQRA